MTSPQDKGIRVCLLDDHPVVRAGLKMLLAAEPAIGVIAEANDRREALDIAKRERPDIFLVDIKLGEGMATDFLPELLASSKNTRAILLTSITDRDELCRAVSAGARGLVYKDEAPEVLIRAIQKVHSGDVWLPRALMASALSELLAGHNARPAPNGEAEKIASLTRREREIVALIASGVNRKKVAERLFVSEATVRNHLTSILKKLDLANQFELVFYAQRRGLSRPPEFAGAKRASFQD